MDGKRKRGEWKKMVSETWHYSKKWQLWIWVTFGWGPGGRWLMLMLSDAAAHWLIGAKQAKRPLHTLWCQT